MIVGGLCGALSQCKAWLGPGNTGGYSLRAHHTRIMPAVSISLSRWDFHLQSGMLQVSGSCQQAPWPALGSRMKKYGPITNQHSSLREVQMVCGYSPVIPARTRYINPPSLP